MKDMAYYKKTVLKDLPGCYKIKCEVKSLTPNQQLSLIKIFIERDIKKEGLITLKAFTSLLRDDLKFKVSEAEIYEILKVQLEIEDQERLLKEPIDITCLLTTVDILKREKLILVQIGNSLSYVSFFIFLSLVIVYSSYFYDYKSNKNLS